MKKHFMFIATLPVLLVATFCGCQKSSSVQSKTSQVKSEPAPIVFIALDGSGSYDYYDKGKMKLKKLVDSLPFGSKVVVRWITSDSYQDSNSIITKSLPTAVEAGTNAFDKRKRIERVEVQFALKKAKEEIWTYILKTQYPKSKFTDLYGFFLVVSERVGQSRHEGRPVYLVILSDLKHNQNKYKKHLKKNCLAAAKVYLLAFETTTPDLRTSWKGIFTNHLGTEVPIFIGLDEDLPDIFLQERTNVEK